MNRFVFSENPGSIWASSWTCPPAPSGLRPAPRLEKNGIRDPNRFRLKKLRRKTFWPTLRPTNRLLKITAVGNPVE